MAILYVGIDPAKRVSAARRVDEAGTGWPPSPPTRGDHAARIAPGLGRLRLKQRVGWQKACVALANKNARILWAVMTREAGFDAAHVSVKPGAKIKPAHSPPAEGVQAAPPIAAPAMCT